MTNSNSQLPAIRRDAIEAFRSYRAGGDKGETRYLRTVAEKFVAAREHFLTQDGTPDWLGRTYEYRRWVREVALEAGFVPDELPTVLSAIRYHVGLVLRSRISTEDARELGLNEESQRERAGMRRASVARTVKLVSGAGIETAEDVVEVLRLLASALDRVEPETVTLASAGERAAVAKAASDVRARLAQVVELTRTTV